MSDRASVSEPAAGGFRRHEALARLASESFDVLVIGGGITGAGVALDAASRGLRTALVEKDDFASGTSSKSSKLVHGGLRYLQQNEFRLVYENLAERQRLLENAPHLVSPLPFLIPLFGRDGVVNRGVARVYRTALWLYDLTGGVRIGRRHEKVTRAQALAHMPNLQADRLVAGFLYWDARTDDARLTLTVLRTAVLDHGAVAANHVRATALTTGPDGRVDGATVTSEEGESFDIRASVVVNAAGVWADDVRALDEGQNPHSIRPAKGIHITVPEAAFPCDIAAVIPVRQDHRSIFVVSWGDQVYLGTTDTEWDGPLDDPSCLPEDVDYILDAANAITTKPIGRDDITGIWTGLRPLLAPVEGKHAPSERTADLSRRHTVRVSPEGMVTVTGGKLTTYRKMAEDTVDAALGVLGRKAGPCVTKSLRLRGATGRPVRARSRKAQRRRAPAARATRARSGRRCHRRRRPPGRPLRVGDTGRAGHGRRTARVARPAGPRAPLPGRRGRLRRRGGDGPFGGRRPRPAHPGLPARRPRRGRGRHPGGRPHRSRARVGRSPIGPTRPRRTPRASATIWPGPDSTRVTAPTPTGWPRKQDPMIQPISPSSPRSP